MGSFVHCNIQYFYFYFLMKHCNDCPLWALYWTIKLSYSYSYSYNMYTFGQRSLIHTTFIVNIKIIEYSQNSKIATVTVSIYSKIYSNLLFMVYYVCLKILQINLLNRKLLLSP